MEQPYLAFFEKGGGAEGKKDGGAENFSAAFIQLEENRDHFAEAFGHHAGFDTGFALAFAHGNDLFFGFGTQQDIPDILIFDVADQRPGRTEFDFAAGKNVKIVISHKTGFVIKILFKIFRIVKIIVPLRQFVR